MSEWIKCSDRLPDNEEDCYFFAKAYDWPNKTKTMQVLHGYYNLGSFYYIDIHSFQKEVEVFQAEDVTHWMQEPQKPTT